MAVNVLIRNGNDFPTRLSRISQFSLEKFELVIIGSAGPSGRAV